jgi:hypothetical protein
MGGHKMKSGERVEMLKRERQLAQQRKREQRRQRKLAKEVHGLRARARVTPRFTFASLLWGRDGMTTLTEANEKAFATAP